MINKIKKTFLTPEFLRFVIIGGINTLNHNIVYWLVLAIKPSINYMIANFIAFCVSMVISFFLSCYFTFKIKPTWKKFAAFPLTNIPNLFFQTVGIYIIVDVIGIPKQYGALIATICALPITFIVMKFILLFKKKETKKTNM
jgi:putative flippase GtrA